MTTRPVHVVTMVALLLNASGLITGQGARSGRDWYAAPNGSPRASGTYDEPSTLR